VGCIEFIASVTRKREARDDCGDDTRCATLETRIDSGMREAHSSIIRGAIKAYVDACADADDDPSPRSAMVENSGERGPWF
jgi:hypothetical protein